MNPTPERIEIRILALLGALLGALAYATPVQAQISTEDQALATALFKEARALLKNNEVAEACRKFQESQRLDPSGGTLLNLAACNEKIGRTASAWTQYNEALAWARRDGRTDRVQFAMKHLQALEPRLSYIVLEVPTASQVDGLEVHRNGSVVRKAAWGSRMPLDPGKHVIEVSAVGYRTWRRRVSVDGEGSEQTITIPRLVPSPSARVRDEVEQDGGSTTSPATPEKSETLHSVPWPSYVLGGVGVVGVGAGTYFGLRAFSKDAEARDGCDATGCSRGTSELTEEAGRDADISTVAFSVGIVGLGAGMTVWLLNSDESTQTSHVAPVLGPGHAGMQWSGSF